jgi:hypothetical protein
MITLVPDDNVSSQMITSQMIQLAPDDNIFNPDNNIKSQMITLAPDDNISSQMITFHPT